MILSVQNDQHLMFKAGVFACMGERGGRGVAGGARGAAVGGGGEENGRGEARG